MKRNQDAQSLQFRASATGKDVTVSSASRALGRSSICFTLPELLYHKIEIDLDKISPPFVGQSNEKQFGLKLDSKHFIAPEQTQKTSMKNSEV